MKAFRQVGLVIFLLLAAVGFTYFGPAEYTGFITKTSFYRYYLGPNLDRFMALTGQGSLTIAYMTDSEGSVDFTPGNDTVTLPARPGQRFPRRTTVSTAGRSRAEIMLLDDSKITLEANSTVLLDVPENSSGEAITLKVLSGSVVAEKSAASTSEITVVSPKGATKILTQKKLAVVAPKAPKGTSAATQEEFFGTPEEPLEKIQARLAQERQKALAAQQSELEGVAVEEEAARKAAELAAAGVKAPTDPGRVPAVAGGERSIARVIQPRRKPASVRWAPPPEGNDLSQAFYAERAGRRAESKRLLARSLTKPSYGGEEPFNQATQVALDGLLKGYVDSGNVSLARETLANVEKNYAEDAAAQSWAAAWRRRLGSVPSSDRRPASVRPARPTKRK